MEAPYDLAGPAHDRDDWRGPPARSYVLCSMPRSGSSLLAEAFHATGRLGTPIEYLDRTNTFAVLRERWGTPTFDRYVDTLHHRRTTAEGLFGTKLHWFHLAELADGLAAEGALVAPPGGWPARRRAALDRLAPRRRVVLCTRRDHVRQAVSWWVAAQTGRWSSVDGRAVDAEPVYDRRAIERRLRLAAAGERAWRRFLAATGDDVLEVAYEDLAADYEATVRSAAAHVGVALAPGDVPAPRLRRQSDGRSAGFVERFLAERRGA